MVLAILIGNVIYFSIQPLLSETFVHELFRLDTGLLLDFAICVGVYLLFLKPRSHSDPGGSP
jgi:hypothetical protein